MSESPVKDEMWQVYLPEWLIVYSSRAGAQPGWEECHAWYQDHYRSRIYSDDWRIVPVGNPCPGQPNRSRSMLQLRLNNLRGEFWDKADAEKLAGELGTGAEVVAKFSREARKRTEYGKRTLHDKS